MRNSLILFGIVAAAGFVRADNFNYSDFSSVSGLTLNGDAAQVGNVLRVAQNTLSQTGTAYATTAVGFNSSTAFNTSFEFNIATDTGNPTDGFTFLLQSQGVNAVGGAGQGSGYTGISPSLAVLFRGRGPAFIGAVVNGIDPLPGAPAGATLHTEGDFYNKNEFAWIDYDPTTTELSVYLSDTSTKPGTADMTTTVDVAGTVGPSAYVGFSAGTGAGFGNNDILNWSFNSTAVPDSTGSLAALSMGLGALGLFRFVSARKSHVAAK